MSTKAPAHESKSADRVLDLLDRWAARCNGHHHQRRESPRSNGRLPLTICIPDKPSNWSSLEGKMVQGWMRNISRRGVSFICRQEIAVKKITVLLPNPNGQPILMQAEIVRARLVHEGFHEYGTVFRARSID